MNVEEFRKYGKQTIDYICEYVENIRKYDVSPTLDPGYLKPLIPDEAPINSEKFDVILNDFDKKIMPGILHWSHPRFFAYFPSGNSFPSILGDMLSSAMGGIGFSWASCPALTELETVILDWYAKALDLPKFFLNESSQGGSALQGSASDSTLICMLTARWRVIQTLKGQSSDLHDSIFLPQLVAYASKEAHSSIEKAAKIALVKLRIIDADKRGRMRVDLLRESINVDISVGLTPFFVVATVGTTGSCAFDDIYEIGKICQEISSVWFHVDGAYAGNSFILPEMRKFAKGLEYADSFNTNPNKFLLTNFDASAMWVRDVRSLKTALNVDPIYLQHEHEMAIDYRHYGIPLSRRFRALKLWFVFRNYGISGIQAYIRNHIALAKKFEMLVRKDHRFEVRNDVHLGLVCFRMRVSDKYNQELLANINHTGKMHMVPSIISGKYVIRFCVTYEHATERDIVTAWNDIKGFAEDILREATLEMPRFAAPISETKAVLISGISEAKNKLTRAKSLRYSFTRSISREIYRIQSEHLRDDCTPIFVVDTSAVMDSLIMAITDDNATISNKSEKDKNNLKTITDVTDVTDAESSK